MDNRFHLKEYRDRILTMAFICLSYWRVFLQKLFVVLCCFNVHEYSLVKTQVYCSIKNSDLLTETSTGNLFIQEWKGEFCVDSCCRFSLTYALHGSAWVTTNPIKFRSFRGVQVIYWRQVMSSITCRLFGMAIDFAIAILFV
jgi:hypothetical protein